MSDLPLFLTLTGRDVVLVGGGRVAAAKLQALLVQRACGDCAGCGSGHRAIGCRDRPPPFVPADLDGAWLVVAAAAYGEPRVAAAAKPGGCSSTPWTLRRQRVMAGRFGATA
jgi:hypothetical protein